MVKLIIKDRTSL